MDDIASEKIVYGRVCDSYSKVKEIIYIGAKKKVQ